jgi:hypothetical protein
MTEEATSIPMLTDMNQTASQAQQGTNTGPDSNGSRCQNFMKLLCFLIIWIKPLWRENGKSFLLVILAFIIGVLIGWLGVPAYIQRDLNETIANQTKPIIVNKLYCPDIPDCSIPENVKSLDFSTKPNMRSFFTAIIFKEEDVQKQHQIIHDATEVLDELKMNFVRSLEEKDFARIRQVEKKAYGTSAPKGTSSSPTVFNLF